MNVIYNDIQAVSDDTISPFTLPVYDDKVDSFLKYFAEKTKYNYKKEMVKKIWDRAQVDSDMVKGV